MQYFVKIVLGCVEFGKFIRTNKVSDKKKDAGMRNVSGGCRLVEHLSPPCHAGACAHVPGQDMRPRGRLCSDFGRQCLALNQPVQRGCLQTAVSLCDTGSLVIIKKNLQCCKYKIIWEQQLHSPHCSPKQGGKLFHFSSGVHVCSSGKMVNLWTGLIKACLHCQTCK